MHYPVPSRHLVEGSSWPSADKKPIQKLSASDIKWARASYALAKGTDNTGKCD